MNVSCSNNLLLKCNYDNRKETKILKFLKQKPEQFGTNCLSPIVFEEICLNKYEISCMRREIAEMKDETLANEEVAAL